MNTIVVKLTALTADKVIAGSPPAEAMGMPVCGVASKIINRRNTALISSVIENTIPRQLAHRPVQTVFNTEDWEGHDPGSAIFLARRV